ncbi:MULTISPECIES: phosphoribosylaminoimidazolesuccinocarboxamide synthase [unclassified Candidatus Frackibacter]|uniref:phosphoribosylaminoimidazolesuccinocarboxamide synthase n=1 Tax=unclassified Candidatus Frackibacter TaxID=2648818 RepID=UPI00088B8327|nr:MULTISPECIES: phosphoribosylaminoimidazolesuccinocarboxamide synthase [unclassified Candidatus Frackibacter]SDC44638.1 phosphoribosylaminoimidazole-succinocarboxamide synthase [Candidatus Frackibacter sp. WG11]SEM64689.1 phosphoribosylaminoimidazole-succinocarboxamide synthase [Candidatus Frackibacter sp. WG12]SFL67848.1 phosphoribosylaminoimidazole-succinocarboxamide synthase [Candidatus Frackibacter sp. WG13]
MEKLEELYEGKAKRIYETEEDDKVIVEYKDDATAFNGEKKGQIAEKGKFNAEISTIFFELLEENDIPTHFIEQLNEIDILVKKLDIILVEVVMRNIAAGSLAKRLGLEEGTELKKPVLEFYYKDDDLGDPMINEYHIYAEELATADELETIKELAFKINEILVDFLADKGIDLVDFKLEFGKGVDGKVYLGDEISPDTCRFWDSETKKKLDKDRFRRDLGEVEGAYKEILNRLKS